MAELTEVEQLEDELNEIEAYLIYIENHNANSLTQCKYNKDSIKIAQDRQSFVKARLQELKNGNP